MRNVCCNVLSSVDTASANGGEIDANQLVSASFHIFFGDATADGTVKIQASNDPPPAGNLNTFTVTNWVDIPSASATVTSGGACLITITVTSYRWMRAVWTRASGGSTTITVNMNAIGI